MSRPIFPFLEIPKEIKDEIMQKNRLRKKWMRSRNPEDKRVYNEANKKVKLLVREFKEKQNLKKTSPASNKDDSIPLETNNGSSNTGYVTYPTQSLRYQANSELTYLDFAYRREQLDNYQPT